MYPHLACHVSRSLSTSGALYVFVHLLRLAFGAALGLNPAGVSLFRLRAPRHREARLRTQCFWLGFRWCLAFSGRVPTSFIFVLVPARLRYGCSRVTAAFALSLKGSKGDVSTPAGTLANRAFLAFLGPDLGGVWLFRVNCRRASFLAISLPIACN